MKDKLDKLRARMQQLIDANASIRAAADGEGRDLSHDDKLTLRENNDEFEAAEEEASEIQRELDNIDSMTSPQARRTDVERVNSRATHPQATADRRAIVPARQVTVADRSRNPAGVWDSFGDFLQSVRRSTISPQAMDQRLIIRGDIATSFSQSDVGAEGGFAIPPDFRESIMQKLFGETTMLGRTDTMTTSTNAITMPIDESEPWSATGLQVRWEGEGVEKLTSVIDIDQQTVRANKLAGVVPVTDELLEDAPALDAYIRRKMPEKIDFKVTLAIIQGSGTGQPLGILNSASRVIVDPGAAPSGTIQYPHVTEMYSRMPANNRANAVWLVHPEMEPALMTMAFMPQASATFPASPVPVYLPPNGLSTSPYATLMGRPVVPTQACNELGVEGDIIFADLKQYMTLVKGGIRLDVSIHVYFLQDLTAFRFVMRIGGKPWWKKVISPRTGTFTMSPFVVLGDR